MATRKIITIDEDKCNGCGNCISGCAEGALQLVNGKAKLVKEQFCDGFGDCIGTCPTGALKIVERDADEFDTEATRQNLLLTQGIEAVRRMDAANAAHDRGEHPSPAPHPAAPHAPHGGGCPGTRMRMAAPAATPAAPTPSTGSGMPGQVMPSALEHWPVQLHLVQPGAPFFAHKEMAILSTCSPIASADVHWRFMKGRSVVVACPKLDRTEPYAAKLGEIFKDPTIPKAIIVRMEVPCCGGLTHIVQEARHRSGRQDLVVEEVTVGLDGAVLGTTTL
jgi:NAD-dependent dihydropyrimidine dehydrogenase PreA subunit